MIFLPVFITAMVVSVNNNMAKQYTVKISDRLPQKIGNGNGPEIFQEGNDMGLSGFLDHFAGRHIQLEVESEIC